MADIINLLPDSVANQIAAGEVVQRPASVVKEMMENCIDAGASRIEVHIFDAGKAGIQVVDNGQGMSGTDARLCFERHATSKIHDTHDLNAIATMGFRGEALASIAAVAEVTLISRRAEDEMGTKVSIAGSKVIEHTAVAAPSGTNFFVRNLFFNVPARRRFLKSTSVELKHIVSEFQRVALANPQVAMRLTSDGATLYDLSESNRKERVLGIFGLRLEKSLLPITVHTDIVTIEGYIGTPKSAKRRAGEQFLFVNARYMRSPALNRAIYSAFEKLIASDSMPIFFIFFSVDPATIDVNIHPQKTEIKFENDQVIWQLLHSAVREALGKHSGMPQIDFNAPPLTSGSFFPPSSFFSISEQERTEFYSALPDSELGRISLPNFSAPGDRHVAVPSRMNDYPSETAARPAAGGNILQIANRYIAAEANGRLMVIDQHRAHARVLYERLTASAPSSSLSQGLATPVTISITPAQRATLREFMEEVGKIGFSLRQRDDATLEILAVPLWLNVEKCAELVASMLDDNEELGDTSHTEAWDAYLRRLAFSAAIKRGEALTAPRMHSLFQDLFACTAPAVDPRGNPTYVLLNEEGISKLFLSQSAK